MNKMNIPLKKRIKNIIFIIFGTIILSMFYYFYNVKSMNYEINLYKKKVNDWKKRVLEVRNKISKIEKDIVSKEKQVKVSFSKEEINELINVYSLICKYLGLKYNIDCFLQKIKKDSTFINVVDVIIKLPNNNFKNTIIIANILSYFTNKFIALKTNIKVKEIKIIKDNKIIIQLYKGDSK